MILQLVYTPIEMIKSIAPDIESMSEPVKWRYVEIDLKIARRIWDFFFYIR